MEFHASVNVALLLPAGGDLVANYLNNPQYLVNALQENSRVSILRIFPFTCRLEMHPLELLQWLIQPTVDLRLESLGNGGIVIRSIATAIKGVDWIDQRFALNLLGTLIPETVSKEQTLLSGKAELSIQVQLPTIVQLCPPLLLQTAGDRLTIKVLTSMKQRLEKNLLESYLMWENSHRLLIKTPNL